MMLGGWDSYPTDRRFQIQPLGRPMARPSRSTLTAERIRTPARKTLAAPRLVRPGPTIYPVAQQPRRARGFGAKLQEGFLAQIADTMH
jgi:hypothetical protein